MASGLVIAGAIGAAVFSAGLAADVLLLAGLFRKRWSIRLPAARLRASPWTWHDAVVLVLAVVLAHGVFAAWYTLFGGAGGRGVEDIGRPALVVQTLLFHGAAGGALLYLFRTKGLSWKRAFPGDDVPIPPRDGDSGGTLRHHLSLGVLFYAAAMPPVAVLALLYRLLLDALNYPVEPQEVITLFLSPACPLWLQLYLGALAVFVAPVVEEACFRGLALPLLSRQSRPAAAVTAASLLFAMVHFHLPSLVPLFGIAVAFALSYLYTGSLVPSIVMHALFNAVSITVLILTHDLPLF